MRIGFFFFVILIGIDCAQADSYCDFNSALIGTRALGIIQPLMITGSTRHYSLPDGNHVCEVPTYSAPEMGSVEIHNCSDFLSVNGPPDYENEYFALPYFKVENDFALLELRTGRHVWVKGERIEKNVLNMSPNYNDGGNYPPDELYSADFKNKLPPPSVRGDVQDKFWRILFKREPDRAIRYENGVIVTGINDESSIDAEFVGFYYEFQKFVKHDGAIWIEAIEKLEAPLCQQGCSTDGNALFSAPIRKVYVRHRDREGNLLLLADSNYCD